MKIIQFDCLTSFALHTYTKKDYAGSVNIFSFLSFSSTLLH
jgi:hypothetical protein